MQEVKSVKMVAVTLTAKLVLLPTVRRLPAYASLAWRVVRDRRIQRRHKIVLMAGAGYVLSPIDLIPGFIPVIGQLDDAAVLLLSLRATLRLAPVEAAEAHLAATGLSWDQIDDDLARLAAGGKMLTLAAARVAARAAVGAGRFAGGLGRRLLVRSAQ